MTSNTPDENLPQHYQESGLHPVDQLNSQKYLAEHQSYPKAPWVSQSAYPEDDGIRNRRIAGLQPWLFWLLVALIGLTIVGASVGGAVGGSMAVKHSGSNASQSESKDSSSQSSSAFTPSSSGSSSTSTTSSTPSSTPSLSASSDCPSSNGTSFTPKSPGGNAGKYTLTKRCGADTDGANLIEAFVPDFNTCLALCSNWNYFQPGSTQCTSAVFNAKGSPPGNCWAKAGTKFVVSSGVDAAMVS